MDTKKKQKEYTSSGVGSEQFFSKCLGNPIKLLREQNATDQKAKKVIVQV